MTKDETLRLALEALGEFERAGLATLKTIDAIIAIKQALEETPCVSPEPEPVAWGMPNKDGDILDVISPDEHERLEGGYTVPLYTSLQRAKGEAPKREWQGLTDEEVFDIWLNEMPARDKVFYQKLCRSVEAKLKEKNT